MKKLNRIKKSWYIYKVINIYLKNTIKSLIKIIENHILLKDRPFTFYLALLPAIGMHLFLIRFLSGIQQIHFIQDNHESNSI